MTTTWPSSWRHTYFNWTPFLASTMTKLGSMFFVISSKAFSGIISTGKQRKQWSAEGSHLLPAVHCFYWFVNGVLNDKPPMHCDFCILICLSWTTLCDTDHIVMGATTDLMRTHHVMRDIGCKACKHSIINGPGSCGVEHHFQLHFYWLVKHFKQDIFGHVSMKPLISDPSPAAWLGGPLQYLIVFLYGTAQKSYCL